MIYNISFRLLNRRSTKFRLRPRGTTDINTFKITVQTGSLNVLCHASNIPIIYISPTWPQFRKKTRNISQTSGIRILFRNNLSRFRSEYSQNVTLVRFQPSVRQGQITNAFRRQNNGTLMGLAKKVYDYKVF
jgi:hypothetical protein